MSNAHDLKTVQDIANVVNPKNIECFLVDFRQFLELNIEVRNQVSIPFSSDFIWIDDGETGLKEIKIKVVDKN